MTRRASPLERAPAACTRPAVGLARESLDLLPERVLISPLHGVHLRREEVRRVRRGCREGTGRGCGAGAAGCSGVERVRTSLPFLSILKVGIALTPYCDCRSLHSSTSTCDHTHTNRQSVCSHTGAAARVRARAMRAWLASGWRCVRLLP